MSSEDFYIIACAAMSIVIPLFILIHVIPGIRSVREAESQAAASYREYQKLMADAASAYLKLAPDERPFLSMIAEYPNEPGPLEVFADWLEERGEVDRSENFRRQARMLEVGNDPKALVTPRITYE